jgi:hypothetical protein
MTDTDFAGIRALGARSAGYAVAQKCLDVQEDAERRDPSLRGERHRILHEDARSWYLGALGEMRVGVLLEGLGPGWFVRHAVPIGAGTKDIDHLVIGPAGVFAINSKHHSGASVWVGDHAMRVNNTPKHYLTDVARDATDAGKRLAAKAGFEVEATPVIALVNVGSFTETRSTNEHRASVIPSNQLVAWLQRQPARLTKAELGLLRIAAEEPATWHVDPRAADTFRVMQRFERLCEEIDPGGLRRVLSGGGAPQLPARSRPAPPRKQVVRARPRRRGPGRVKGRGIEQLIGAIVLISLAAVAYFTQPLWGAAVLEWWVATATPAMQR